MKAIVTISLTILCMVGALAEVVAQNLESIGQSKPLTVSGGLNINQVGYAAKGTDQRDPYNYFLSAHLNFSLYGWSVPLSFSYSNQNSTFSQPFNQYGLSPTYKWITLHAGYRTMTFSPYTLNGHLFLGGGLEVQPTPSLKIAAMYGRLQKAVEEDTVNVNVPAYHRMGGGAKVTLVKKKHEINFTVFKAQDDPNSLETAPVASDVNPEENLVLGVGFRTNPMEGLSLEGEYASSAISEDIREEGTETSTIYNRLHFLFQPRTSSSYYQAMKGQVNYQFSRYSIGAAYERVEPGYRSLGAYYFNNNLENVSLTHTSTWWSNKATFNARFGMQRNNLDQAESSSMNRFSTSLGLGLQLSDRLNTSWNYSNFTTVVNFQPIEEQLTQVTPFDYDSLNYLQIAQNANANISYILSQSSEKVQNLNVNVGYQRSRDEQGGEATDAGSKFYNLNTAYSVSMAAIKLSVSVAANANLSISTSESLVMGPSINLRKVLMQALSGNLSVSYNTSKLDGTTTASIWNTRLGASYVLKDKHQFSLNVTALDRTSVQNEATTQLRELVGEFGYSYNFSTR